MQQIVTLTKNEWLNETREFLCFPSNKPSDSYHTKCLEGSTETPVFVRRKRLAFLLFLIKEEMLALFLFQIKILLFTRQFLLLNIFKFEWNLTDILLSLIKKNYSSKDYPMYHWNYFNTKFQSRINSAKSLSFHKSYLITTLKNTFFGKTKNELRRKRVASSLSLGNSQPVD